MNRKLCAMTFFIALMALTCACSAEVLIDFEDLNSGDEILDHYPGLHFNNLTICYDNESSNQIAYPPHSGTRIIGNLYTPIRVDFDSPVCNVSGWFMTNTAGDAYLEAYDENDILMDMDLVNTGLGGSAKLSVTAPSIKYVIMRGRLRYWAMDDFAYDRCPSDPTEAPEFGSLALAVAILFSAPAFAYLLVRK